MMANGVPRVFKVTNSLRVEHLRFWDLVDFLTAFL
jgi:hypothetical protein